MITCYIQKYPILSNYKNGIKQWLMFLSNDTRLKYSNAGLIKGIHLEVDSSYVVALYSNGNTWYEGLFVKNKQGTGIKKGIHKVFVLTKGDTLSQKLY